VALTKQHIIMPLVPRYGHDSGWSWSKVSGRMVTIWRRIFYIRKRADLTSGLQLAVLCPVLRCLKHESSAENSVTTVLCVRNSQPDRSSSIRLWSMLKHLEE
jgi:hypothetical protein